MKMRLDLSKHCIETEVRQRHEAAMSSYFKGKADKAALEAKLVLLEKALAAFDFDDLRGRFPILAGGDQRPVDLVWDDAGHPCLQFEDRTVVPPADEARSNAADVSTRTDT